MAVPSVRRGARIVKQVLTFARGVQGESVMINPRHLVDEMIDIAQSTFPKTIKIIGQYQDDLWSIQGDPTQLHQVLLNLAVNARDAMPHGGRLVISAENLRICDQVSARADGATPGFYVLLRVSDTGEGIAEAIIEKIFDPFFTTKGVGKGTGLGLSTTIGIIKKGHHGFISVKSTVGKGTTFEVLLPAVETESERSKSVDAADFVSGHGELILMVDDEPSICDVGKMVLESHGSRVVCARDGLEALTIFSKQRDDIRAVVTDMIMPHMGGMSLIRELKGMKPETIVIACTGEDSETARSELEGLGVSRFLSKPYDAQTLLLALQQALN